MSRSIRTIVAQSVIAVLFATCFLVHVAAAQKVQVSLSTAREADGCVKITVVVRNGGANFRDLHLLVAVTNHQNGKEETLFGDPRKGQYSGPSAGNGWVDGNINTHNGTGAPAGPNGNGDTAWWQTWTNPNGGGAQDTFSIKYCGDRDVDYTKNPPVKGFPGLTSAVVVTKTAAAGGVVPVGWTAADKITYEAGE